MKPHKWAKEICAWANGAEIQFNNGTEWLNYEDTDSPMWLEHTEYRIKPQPKEPRYAYAWLVKDEERIDFYFDKPEGVLNDDYHQYIGKIKLIEDK